MNSVSDEDFTCDLSKVGKNQAWNTDFSCLYGLGFNVVAVFMLIFTGIGAQDSIIRLIEK